MDLKKELEEATKRRDSLRDEFYRCSGVVDFIQYLMREQETENKTDVEGRPMEKSNAVPNNV
jgi:hypothetical protein